MAGDAASETAGRRREGRSAPTKASGCWRTAEEGSGGEAGRCGKRHRAGPLIVVTRTQARRLGGSAARRLGGSAARRLGGSAARRLGGSADHCNNAFQCHRQGTRRRLHGVIFPDATTRRLANPSFPYSNESGDHRMALAPHRCHGAPLRTSSRPALRRPALAPILAHPVSASHNACAAPMERSDARAPLAWGGASRNVGPARRTADAGGRADIGRWTLVGIGSDGVRGHGQARCAVRARPARRPRRQRADEPLDGAGSLRASAKRLPGNRPTRPTRLPSPLAGRGSARPEPLSDRKDSK